MSTVATEITASTSENAATIFDLAVMPLREVNQALHAEGLSGEFVIDNPFGAHNVAVGIDAPVKVTINGHLGYFAAGMNKQAEVTINGNAGQGLAENQMSGVVHVTGSASQSAGATGRGGLLIIDGDAGARCGISLKGLDIVVGGSIGHMSAFMAQRGRLVVRGDAGDTLGDSLYEARIYVRGTVKSLGADCVEKEMRAEHLEELAGLLKAAGYEDDDPASYQRYGSARTLYHFHADNTY
ncbi:protein glxC [Nocardia sp. NPDC052112]|uniref:GltB/FmdC/FwdC-like GXGXG domain-containing protein n=1 Tax=Nocardia sp. NPDC052112 TaxID=3155646 RepID=UPI003419B38A